MTYDDTVVAAIDEKDLDLGMLRWAAEEATARKTPLVLRHAHCPVLVSH